MFFRAFLRSSIFGTLIFGAALSGGCSSSGGSDGALTPDPVVYSGSTKPAAITAHSAQKFFALIWDGANATPSVGTNTAASRVATPNVTGEFSASSRNERLRRMTQKSLLTNNSSSTFAAINVNDTSPGATSGTKVTHGTLGDDGKGTLTITYTNFNDGDGYTYDGTITVEIRAFNLDYGLPTDMLMSNTLLTIKSATNNSSISGTVHFQDDLTNNTETQTQNIDGRDNTSGGTYRFENFVVVTRFNPNGDPISETDAGRVYIDTEGYVDLTTTVQAQCSVCPLDNPDSGGPFVLSGANGSKAQVTPASSTKVRIQVDTTGDGTFEITNTYLWTNINGAPSPNDPPVVGAVSIQPATVRAGDSPIVQISSLKDADGDVLTTTYVWQKNGKVIVGQTGKILPSGNFKKSDVINVTANISDGTHNATATSVPIIVQDTPPTIAIATPPSVTYGQPVKFSAIGNDIDNDPVVYSISYGPVGMQINDSGQISWTPSGLLFEANIEVGFSIRATAGGASANVVGSTTVKSDTSALPLTRTALVAPRRDDGDRMEGARIVDFKTGLKNQILMTDQRKILYTLTYDPTTKEYKQDWAYPFDLAPDGVISGIDVGDVNGDNHPDIIVTHNYGITIIDGVTRKIIGSIVDEFLIHNSIRVLDLDADGKPEIVFLGTNENILPTHVAICVYDASNLKQIWKSEMLNLGTSMAIGNVDNDAALEIVTSNGYVFDGASHSNEWNYSPGFGDIVAVGDIDNDGIEEIVGAGSYLRVFNARSRTKLAELGPITASALLVANLDASLQSEIVIGEVTDLSPSGASISAFSYNKKTVSLVRNWTSPSRTDYAPRTIAVGDTDNDGTSEIVWTAISFLNPRIRSTIVVSALTPTLSTKWSNNTFDSNTYYPYTPGFDINGPYSGGRVLTTSAGSKRVVFASNITPFSGTSNKLVSINLPTGDVEISNTFGFNNYNVTCVDGSDYDNDGVDELYLCDVDSVTGKQSINVYDFVKKQSESTLLAPDVDILTAVTHGDVTGDGHDDVVTAGRSFDASKYHVYVYDVYNHALIWQSSETAVDVKLADLDNDGNLELLIASYNSVSVYKQSLGGNFELLKTLPITSLSTPMNVFVAVGDADGDGIKDIVVGNRSFIPFIPNGEINAIVVFDGKTFDEKSRFAIDDKIVTGAHISDMQITTTKNGGATLFVAFSTNLSGGWQPYDSIIRSGIVAVDPMTGAEIWKSPALIDEIPRNSVTIGDANQDGLLDIVVGTSSAMYITH